MSRIHILADRHLVLAQAGHELWQWNVESLFSGEAAIGQKLNGMAIADDLTSFAVSFDELTIAVAQRNGQVQLLGDFGPDRLPTRLNLEFETGGGSVVCMGFSLDKRFLFLGMDNTVLQCRSALDGSLLKTFKNKREPIRALEVWGGGVIWTDSTSYSVSNWQVESGASLRSDRLSGTVVDVATMGGFPVSATRDGGIQLLAFRGLSPAVVSRARGPRRIDMSFQTKRVPSVVYRPYQRSHPVLEDRAFGGCQKLGQSPAALYFHR